MSQIIHLPLSDRIKVGISFTVRKNDTDKGLYDLYLNFNLTNGGCKEAHRQIGTGAKIPVKQWQRGMVTGKSIEVQELNERLNSYRSIAISLLKELSIQKPSCSLYIKAIEGTIRETITGKKLKRLDATICPLQDQTYESVMNRLIAERGISPNRQKGYKRSLDLLTEFYGGKIPTINKIAGDDLQLFKEWLSRQLYAKGNSNCCTRKKYANDTLTDYKSKIAAVIKFAVQKKHINTNPLPDNFRGSWIDDSKKDILNEPEMLSLMNLRDCQLTPCRLIAKYCALVKLFTSLGYTDLTLLRYEDFKIWETLDDANEVLRKEYIQGARGKNGLPFTIFTPPQIKKYVDKLIELVGNKEKPFNLTTLENLNKHYQSLMQLSGISKKITSNNFRHTFATDFVEKDGDLNALDYIMGHKPDSNRMTKRYAKISLKRQSEAMESYLSRCKIHNLQNHPLLIIEDVQRMLQAV